MHRFEAHHPCHSQQQGGALLVMLVILVMGAVTIFVTTLNSSTFQIARDKVTADTLAQAREALIGYAVSDANYPGDLPCPDVNDDGQLTLNVDFTGSTCTSPIGRLPWKTLGIPELRDGTGEHLWYAVAKSFWAIGTPSIDSDTAGDLTISGTTAANNVIAIVFAPGNVLSQQSQGRSPTQTASCVTTNTTIAENLCATNYLEGSNANLNLYAAPHTSFQTAAASGTFNDQVIYITHDQLFAPVEMLVARKTKKCLDDYAAANGNKYPWAAPISDASYTGTYLTDFGRVPATPNVDTSAGVVGSASATSLSTALGTLQSALNTYNSNSSRRNRSALQTAARSVILLQNSVAGVSSTTIYQAGYYGQQYARGNSTYAAATSYVTTANSALTPYLPSAPTTDPTMAADWSAVASCTDLFGSSYWPTWADLVFYKVASGYQPGNAASCAANTTCLTINGSGNTTAGTHTDYHAAVIVARQAIGQTRPTSNAADYLEGSNPSPGSSPPTFVTYKSSDTNYTTINDLVLCLDGNVNCQ